jgi:hypothetical protein
MVNEIHEKSREIPESLTGWFVGSYAIIQGYRDNPSGT